MRKRKVLKTKKEDDVSVKCPEVGRTGAARAAPARARSMLVSLVSTNEVNCTASDSPHIAPGGGIRTHATAK
jgi:hypothetical protein